MLDYVNTKVSSSPLVYESYHMISSRLLGVLGTNSARYKSKSKPLHFSSRILFVDQKTFESLPLEEKCTVTEQSDRDIAIFERQGHSRGLISCNGGGVTGAKNKFLIYHFDNIGDLPDQLTKLATYFERLKEQPRKLRALIIGGHSDWKNSKTLGDKLQGFFRTREIPLTLFWGHRSHPDSGSFISDIAYVVKTDTWYVLTKTRDSKHRVRDMDSLNQAFEEVDVYEGSGNQKADYIVFQE